MNIHCRSCNNQESFVLPLWVRATFKIEEDGTLSILHVRQLESLEEKLADQGKTSFSLTCSECGSDEVEVVFDEYSGQEQKRREIAALEAL
ncbi:hypothetical protein ACFL4U_04255 [Candidatus Neomarinimicrobiota bacterium]